MSKKGGKTTTETTVKLPPAIEAAAKQNLAIADQVAAMGAMPYRGPTVAGFSPQQLAGMQGINDAAGAFGMPNVDTKGMSGASLYTALTGLPPPQQFAGGFSGYSGMGLADEQYNNLPPAQRAMLESFVINPVTGANPTNSAVPGVNMPMINPQLGRTPEERAAITRANLERELAMRELAQQAKVAPRRGYLGLSEEAIRELERDRYIK